MITVQLTTELTRDTILKKLPRPTERRKYKDLHSQQIIKFKNELWTEIDTYDPAIISAMWPRKSKRQARRSWRRRWWCELWR
jgi:hypothetical protein